MISRRHAIAALVFGFSCSAPFSLSNALAQPFQPAGKAGTKEFTDPVYRLPRSVANHSEFERIAQSYVDPVVAAYLKSFEITKILGEQKEDQSDRQSMKFWQGTSALHASVSPAVVLSSHTIRYGSNLMVNIVYVSGNDSTAEVKSVDALMNSLSFGG